MTEMLEFTDKGFQAPTLNTSQGIKENVNIKRRWMAAIIEDTILLLH